jgi:hypothetical protein
MNRITSMLLVISVTSQLALAAEEADVEQQKYFQFWKPHSGQWTISITEPGKEDITGYFSYRPSPTKLCYVSRGFSNAEVAVIDGLYGYDADRKCWVDVEIFKLGDSFVFRTVLLRADVGKKLRQGTTVTLDVNEVIGGESIKYSATRVYKTLEKDRIVMVHQDRKTPEGASLPDVTIVLERKK